MTKLAEGTSITDQKGRIYTLDHEIGRGGQGVVWALKESNLAAKIFFRSQLTSEEVMRRIKRVRQFDLDGLPLSVPLAPLERPLVGYIMKLVRGLDPIKRLCKPPRDCNSPAKWYLESGGLRWRLRILAAVAETLAKLHGKGLAFADPSPGNILVPSAVGDSPNVYLIDADNLEAASHSGANFLYTPRYGAPELVTQTRGISTLSDAYAFAVIAFELLTLAHPLIGDAVAEGEPDEEAEALAGKLPWIDHPELNSNRSSRGIPRELVLSRKLRELFAKTFDEGLEDPQKRPGMGSWAERLLQAADMTVRCIDCNGTFYFKPEDMHCPWCEGAPEARARLARFLLWEPGPGDSDDDGCFLKSANGNPTTFHALALQKGEPQVIRKRHFFSDPLSSPEDSVAEVILEGKKALIRNTGTKSLLVRRVPELEDHRGFEIPPGEEQRMPADGSKPRWYLHAGPMEESHRVMSI